VYRKDDSRPTQQEDNESDDEDRSEYSAADIHVVLLQKVQGDSEACRTSAVSALPHTSAGSPRFVQRLIQELGAWQSGSNTRCACF
jgi:hypothetical protein